MKKLVKVLAVLVLAGLLLVGGIGIINQKFLPDHLYLYTGDQFEYRDGLLTLKVPSKNLTPASTQPGGSYNAKLYLFNLIPLKSVRVDTVDQIRLIPGGMTFGVKMFTSGVVVVALGDVYTAGGRICPARNAGLELGDIITEVDGHAVTGNEDLAAIVMQSDGRTLRVSFIRDGMKLVTNLTPANARDGTGFKAGMYVRDSTAGIGTVTYINEQTGIMAGLGHAVTDSDTGVIMPVGSGELVPVEVTGIVKGQVGMPGELKGNFGMKTPIASLDYNCETGIFGHINYSFYDGEALPVAFKQDVKLGKALLLCTLDDGGPRYYEIQIESANLSEGTLTKNMVIRITDPDLLARTGGIVQGMSGSPIIQNGQFVGALTHVFVNDPTKGYGVFIENMLFNEKYAVAEWNNREAA